MPLITKNFTEMINDSIDRIKATTPITNDNANSVIMNILDSIFAEFDVFNYQMNNVYNAISIEDATGTDLDRAFSKFGITRNQATKAVATVTFYVTNPNTFDVIIPIDTLISTKVDTSGNNHEFLTTEEVILSSGSTTVSANIKAVISGQIILSAESIVVINDTLENIEGVRNDNSISAGTNIETDDEFRDRATNALYQYGTATEDALESALLDIDAVTGVVTLDLNRGSGTSDIVISTANIPPLQGTIDAIDIAISSNKASGIDVQAVYPSVSYLDVTITLLNMESPIQEVAQANTSIINYINNIIVGADFIVRQMESAILSESINELLDIVTTLPISNQTPGALEVFRAGTITINGVIQ